LATYVENTPSFKNKIREVAGTATLVAADGVAVVPTVSIVEDATYLPLVGNKDGDITYAQDTETLYIWNSNNWTSTKTTTLAGSAITSAVANAVFSTTAGTVTTAAQPNITSTGTLTSLSVTGSIAISGANVTLGSVSNLHVTGGSNGQVLTTDGTGNLNWASVATAPTATITTDAFSGNGVQTAFTLSVTPDDKQYTTVNINGATLLKSSYSLAGATLTLNEAPDSTADIEITTVSNNISFSTVESGLSTASKARITGYNLIFGG
jgi:hypothetical protein